MCGRYTERYFSTNLAFPSQSNRLKHFTDEARWLALAPETLFWHVAGTNVRTEAGEDDRLRPRIQDVGCCRERQAVTI
jgi:hypothetical protein